MIERARSSKWSRRQRGVAAAIGRCDWRLDRQRQRVLRLRLRFAACFAAAARRRDLLGQLLVVLDQIGEDFAARVVGRRRRGSRRPCRCAAWARIARGLLPRDPIGQLALEHLQAARDRFRPASRAARSRRPATFRAARPAPGPPEPAPGTRARPRPFERARAPGTARAIRRAPVRGIRTARGRARASDSTLPSARRLRTTTGPVRRRDADLRWPAAPLRRNSADTSARSSASIVAERLDRQPHRFRLGRRELRRAPGGRVGVEAANQDRGFAKVGG